MLSRKIREYKLANPKAKAKEIATSVGCKPAYVYQVLLGDAKKDKPEPKPTEGQQVLRKEINRLNEEITKYKNLTKFQEDRIAFLANKIKELRLHHEGLEYVISYLESRLGIASKDDGATV
jgi:hypothetical protein